MIRHKHRSIRVTVAPYFGPVAIPPVRAAHGGVCYVHACKCGATRKINNNGRHSERGPWTPPEGNHDER